MTTIISGIGGATSEDFLFKADADNKKDVKFKNYVFGYTTLTIKNAFRTIQCKTIDI